MNKRFSDKRKIGSARGDNPQGYSNNCKSENGPSQLAYSEWQKAGFESLTNYPFDEYLLGNK